MRAADTKERQKPKDKTDRKKIRQSNVVVFRNDADQVQADYANEQGGQCYGDCIKIASGASVYCVGARILFQVSLFLWRPHAQRLSLGA